MSNFKVGDWVKVKGTLESDIFKLTENEIKYKEIILGHFIFEENTWVHWQPKEGEWCWFYSPFWTDKKPILDTFKCIEENKFRTESGVQTTHCEPFIGELPSFLKDRQ